MLRAPIVFPLLALIAPCLGCQSTQYSERLAAAGGLAGAGLGAIVGHQSGDAAEGALLGAGLGALAGAVAGDQMDETARQNRAAIASQLGRQVAPGTATLPEIVAMHRAGIDPQLIKGYITSSGVAAPLSPDDLIGLHQQGVPSDVIQTLQTASTQPPPGLAPPTVVVDEPLYPPPYYIGPPGWHHAHHPHYGHHRSRVGWSVGIGL